MYELVLRDLTKDNLSENLQGLIQEHETDTTAGRNPPPLPRTPQVQAKALVDYIYWLMDQDRKSTPLKSIQGQIWEAGYNRGELKGEVFSDVPRAFERWASQKRDICIYSSGSVLAQKLLFANAQGGDLTEHITAYFDTNVGPKKEAGSYSRIAEELRRTPREILFLSDTVAELAAASQAGVAAVLCSRPGNQPQSGIDEYLVVETFDDVFPT
jgi:enolase-phosphatase E1